MAEDVAVEEKTEIISDVPEERVVEPVADKVAKIRQELRDGRQRTREAGKPVSGNAKDNATGDGSKQQVLHGQSGGTGNKDRRTNNAQRGAEEKSVRERSADRRLSEADSRANDPVSGTTSANQRTVGRLSSDEPIPARLPELPEAPQPKRGPGRPRKEVEEEKESFFSRGKAKFTEGKPLSHKEAEELREPFIEALKDDFRYLDEALWWWSHDPSEPQIWSDMDDEEVETIAKVMLRRAERSPAAATAVRNIVDASDYIGVCVIMAPRMIKTMQQASKHPKKEKKGKAS